MPPDTRLWALLGPTNTGKTHTAMERMASYGTGMIGFPLRLLARENYDRFVRVKGRHQVALITGEEKIMPLQPRYFICTVEAMPTSIPVDFLAVDEIQLCGDPERGHIFTDRLLHARGREETLFLGSETIKPLMRKFLPHCKIETRPRLSTLSYIGNRKISRLPRRSAIVAFNVNDVYHLAESVRQQRGGTAIVLGALSPRTRNAQVAMYQSGEVDYIVSTDAIGMGLNMDIDHVALASSRKFDGARPRTLRADEIGQIAGRAGRFKNDGTFGTTGELHDLDPAIVQAVENHSFSPLEQLRWRNSDLDMTSLDALLKSLSVQPKDDRLINARIADDHRALHHLAKDREIRDLVKTRDHVQLLWDVCQIPDFRQMLTEQHPLFLGEIFRFLMERESLPDDWIAQNLKRLDRVEGDIDTLLMRIAHTRTWTYVTHASNWVRDAETWQNTARRIEDTLSDALHDRLTQRFVDRRSHHLLRQIKNDDKIAVNIAPDGTVIVNDRRLGVLKGWFFMIDDTVSSTASNTERQATLKAAQNLLQTQVQNALDDFATRAADFLAIDDAGNFVWQVKDTTDTLTIAHLAKTDQYYNPKIVLDDASFLNDTQQKTLQNQLEAWFKSYQDKVLQPLLALADLPAITNTARAIAYQVYEQHGVMLRQPVQEQVKALSTEDRQTLHNLGIKLGAYFIYHREMLKTAALKHRATLARLNRAIDTARTPLPAQGNVSLKTPADAQRDFYFNLGFPIFMGHGTDPVAVRIDMVERVNSAVYDKAVEGVYTFDPALASTIGTSVEALQAVLHGLGFRYEEKTEEANATLAEANAEMTDEGAGTIPADAPVPETTSDKTEEAQQAKILRLYHLKKATPFFLRPREDNRDARPKFNKDNQQAKGDKKDSRNPMDRYAPKGTTNRNDFKKKADNKKPDAHSPRDNVIPVKSAKPTGHQAFAALSGLADLQNAMTKKK